MDFITPPNHFGFHTKKIYGSPIEGTFLDCAIACIDPRGGGPRPAHRHLHNHFFIVIDGEATIYDEGRKTIVKEDEAIYLKGENLHTIENETDKPLKMIGITIQTNHTK